MKCGRLGISVPTIFGSPNIFYVKSLFDYVLN